MHLRQSTAVVVQFGPALDKADGLTLLTGLVSALDHGTTGIKLSKNGGTLTIRHATVTASSYDAHGCYKVTLDTTDTNTLGTLRVIYTDAATLLPIWQDFMVLPAVAWDALYASSGGALPANMAQILGTALTEGAGGQLAAGVKKVFDVATPVFTAASVNQTGDSYPLLDTEVAAIKAKTDNLPSDPADASDIAASFSTVNATLATIAGYIDTEVGAIKAKTDNLPSDPADASDIASSFSTVNATLATIAGYIDTEVGAIKAKTDNLPSDPADASDLATAFATVNATLATIAGYVDTEIGAIQSAIAALNNLSSAQAQTAATAALTAYGAATGTQATAPKTLTTGERDAIVAALLDLADAIETGLTLRQALRLIAAAEAGKVSGMATTTVAIRNAVADSKARITATVDADGNRTAITTDLT